MRCPRCDAAVLEPRAAFCAHCGAPLGEAEGETTSEFETPRGGAGTEELAPDGPERQVSRSGVPQLVADFAGSVRRSAATQRWGDLTVAAGFGFLALLAVGALLILAGKLQYPGFGSDADALETLNAIVIAGLGILRVSIHLEEVSVSALPLGALAFAGWATAWAVARVARSSGVIEPREGAELGVRVAAPLALLCLTAALVFRFRGSVPVSADAGGALVMGAIWGALFGVLGGLWGAVETRSQLRAALDHWRARRRELVDGAAAGGLMLITAFCLAAAAGLMWLIVGLLTGGPSEDFDAGELGAAVIYLLAFGPNVLTSIIGVSLGAPVAYGAQITIRGREIGSVDELSLLDWGGMDPPWYAFLLLLVPLIACALGGFYARQLSGADRKMPPVIAIAAVIFSVVLFELAALSEARLGAGLVRDRGVGEVAPQEWIVLVLAFGWAVVVGVGGWRMAGRQRDNRVDDS